MNNNSTAISIKQQVRSAICILFLLSGCLTSFSQNTPFPEIRRIHGSRSDGDYEKAEKIITTADGHFILAGIWQDSAWVMKTTACGEMLWNRKMIFGRQSQIWSICELPDGNLAAAGVCTRCAHGDTADKALVLLLDADGLPLKDTLLGTANLDAAASGIALDLKGRLVVTGTATAGLLSAPTGILLAQFHQDLVLEKYETVTDHFSAAGKAIIATRDSGFAVAGYYNEYASGPTYGRVHKWNAAGTHITTGWEGSDTVPNSVFNTLAETPTGDLIAAGSVFAGSTLRNEVLLTRFSSLDGTRLSRSTLGSTFDDEANDIKPIAKGGYLVLGVYGAPRAAGYGKRDWVFQIDDTLGFTQREYFDEYNAAHRGRSIVPLSPGGENYALVSVRSGAFRQDAFFAKSKRQGIATTFTAAPADFQLYPRDSLSIGHVLVSGTAFSAIQDYDSIRLEVYRSDSLCATSSAPLVYTGGSAAFSFIHDIPAELVNYRFNISGIQGLQVYPEAEACEVVAGDAFIITGQSNAFAYNTWGAYDTVPNAHLEHGNAFVRNFGLKYSGDTVYAWHREQDDDNPYYEARSGEWGLVMADQIADEHGIPVAILNGAINGISIDSMMPDFTDHHNLSRSYGRFLLRTERAGLRDYFRSLLVFQGESNTTLAAAETVESYKAKFDTLNSAWDTDFPGRGINYLFQIRPNSTLGGTLAGSIIVQEAQRQLDLERPFYHIMSSTGMYHDGAHFWYINGYQRAGNDIYRLLNRDLYAAPPADNITPPAVDSLWFSNALNTQLALRFISTDDAITWYPGREADFTLEGSPSTTVLSGSVSGNLLFLDLDAAPASTFTGVSYRSHTVGDECSVKNLNGIGMLCFMDMPVAPFVGVEEGAFEAGITLWPNPGSGVFTVQGERMASIRITDIVGQTVWSSDLKSGEVVIDISGVARGVYVCVVEMEGGEVWRRRVVVR